MDFNLFHSLDDTWEAQLTDLQHHSLATIRASLSIIPFGEFWIYSFEHHGEGQLLKLSDRFFIGINTAGGGAYEDWFDIDGLAHAIEDGDELNWRITSWEPADPPDYEENTRNP